MQVANPIWLWALAGLSVPIAIHLLSRKEGKVIRIGSLRHLRETTTQQFKGIRLNELVLLALRSFLIILFVLLLSGLSFYKSTDDNTKWVIIEKGLEKNEAVKTKFEDLQNQGYEARMFAENFPLLADSATVNFPHSYWKLTEELKAKDLNAIVFSTNKIGGYVGSRPSLPSNIQWISISPEPSEYILSAVASQDSVIARIGNTSGENTSFTTKTFSVSNWNGSTTQQKVIQLALVADASHQYDKKIIEAAIRTIDEELPIDFNFITSSPEKISSEKADWIIWLSNSSIPSSVSNPILYQKSSYSHNLIDREGKNKWCLTKALNEEIALNKNLTIQLATLLVPSETEWRIVSQKDARMMPDSIAWSENISGDQKIASLPLQSAEPYLLVLFLIILLIERILAYHRNQ